MSSPLMLTLTADPAFLPVAVSFVETTCASCGFGKKETTSLMLAAEEVFVYVSQFRKGVVITLNCRPKAYQMELFLSFDAGEVDLRAFNLTSTVDVSDESSLEEMGLVIAGRMVDRLFMDQSGSNIQITFIKYRSYEQPEKDTYQPAPLNLPVVTKADTMETLVLAHMIHGSEPPLPFELTLPSMAADMLAEGDLSAMVLKDKEGTIAGGLLWKSLSENTVEIMGPFVYGQKQPGPMGEALVEKCLETIGKERVTGIICRYYGTMIPEDYFEVIGHLAGRKIYFRQMREDTGAVAWLHPLMEKEIRQQYKALFLPRNIIAVVQDRPPSNPHSVITTELNRSAGRVVMHPLATGQDMKKNLEMHVKLLQAEGYTDITFELDLGRNDHGVWVPALIEEGFVPELMLPYGGKGDMVIMTHHSGSEVEN